MKASFRKQNQNDEEDSNGLARGEERVVQAESTKINRGIKKTVIQSTVMLMC